MRNRYFLIAIIILTIPTIFGLFSNGFFVSDDGDWMIIRFSAFYQALSDGQFPVRFLHRLNFGYGYPVANFLYPGFMYLGVPIKLLGFGFVETIKILMGLSMIFSAVFSFLWLRKIFSDFAAFIGSLFYVYAPYHIYNLWVRGSLGELIALSVIPFSLWQIERQSRFFTALSIALLIISHNTLALFFLPMILLYLYLRINSNKRVLETLVISFLGIGIASFFWIPATLELQFVTFSTTKISEWSEYFADINLIAPVVMVILIILFLLQFKIEKLKVFRLAVTFLIICIVSVFLSSDQSYIIWNFMPAGLIQFPFRFLSIAILSASFLVAFFISKVQPKIQVVLGALIIFVVLYFSYDFLLSVEKVNLEDGFYATNESTTTVKDEYMPKWVLDKPSQHFKQKVEVVEGEAEISSITYNNKKVTFDSYSDTAINARVNTIYYPGWKLLINGDEKELAYSNARGLIELTLPEGDNNIVLKFEETKTRVIANSFSLIFIAGLFIYANASKIKFLKK